MHTTAQTLFSVEFYLGRIIMPSLFYEIYFSQTVWGIYSTHNRLPKNEIKKKIEFSDRVL